MKSQVAISYKKKPKPFYIISTSNSPIKNQNASPPKKPQTYQCLLQNYFEHYWSLRDVKYSSYKSVLELKG